MSERHRILVVDDNPGTRYSTSRVLRSSGFEVVEAASGLEALESAKDIELVVLDINLPDIDGFEVCRRLRGQPETARIPVVHLSATFVTDVHKVEGLAAGADGYLTHPVEPLVLVATVRSFLRAREAEELRSRSDLQFRMVFERAPVGIAVIDSDHRLMAANKAFSTLLGRPVDQLIGMESSMLVSPARQPDYREAVTALERDGQWQGRLTMVRADDSTVEVDWSLGFNPATGIRLAIGTDVTASTKIEAERERLLASERAARAEAERANRLKDEFLATLSHELRNPLNAILGWASVLRRRAPAELSDGLEAIERNARVQAQLISDLLDVARITSGKLRLEAELIDVGKAVAAAIDGVAATAAVKDVEIERHLEAPDARIVGDPGRIQQVVWNLLSNAVKFTPKGGTVSVSVEAVGPAVQIEVKDTGRGIRSEFLPHIFERFRQQDASTTKHYSGLGLGLAIVKHLVELHGGTVEAESGGEDSGSTFRVTLPRSREGGSAVAPSRPRLEHARLDGLRVLVVEDDPDARMLVGRMLRDSDAEVTEAASVAEALDALAAQTPDILLSDIGMAGRDGYELIRQIRAMGHTPATLPAIALTAFARLEDRRDALLAGYQVHLAKPVDPQELLAAVASLTGRTGV